MAGRNFLFVPGPTIERAGFEFTYSGAQRLELVSNLLNIKPPPSVA